jgi:hypothetical protein
MPKTYERVDQKASKQQRIGSVGDGGSMFFGRATSAEGLQQQRNFQQMIEQSSGPMQLEIMNLRRQVLQLQLQLAQGFREQADDLRTFIREELQAQMHPWTSGISVSASPGDAAAQRSEGIAALASGRPVQQQQPPDIHNNNHFARRPTAEGTYVSVEVAEQMLKNMKERAGNRRGISLEDSTTHEAGRADVQDGVEWACKVLRLCWCMSNSLGVSLKHDE